MSHRRCLALVLLLIFGLYARSIANGFTYDDAHYVQVPSVGGFPNTMVASWQGFQKYYTTPYGRGVSAETRNLRPTVVMSFAFVRSLNPDAWLQHLVNIVLHLITTVLVYLLIRRLFENPWPAVAGAAVFGLHALRSDQVIAIIGRAEILSLLFGALGLLLFLAALERGGKDRWLLLIGSAVSSFLCFGAKESGVAWVAFVPLYAIVERWRKGLAVDRDFFAARAVPWLVAVVVPALLFGCLLYNCVAQSEAYIETVNNPVVRAEASVRIATAVMILGYALFQVFFPFWLHADYSYRTFEVVESFGDWRFLVPAVLFAGILIAGLRYARRRPVLFLAVAAFFGFSFVTSNILIPIASIYGERHMYTPGIALCLLVAVGVDAVRAARLSGNRLYVVAAAAGVWLIANGVVIVQRAVVWDNDKSLFENEAHAQPNAIRMQLSAGRQFREPTERLGLENPKAAALRNRWKYYLDRAMAIDDRHPLALSNTAYFHARLAQDMRARGATAAALREESKANDLFVRLLSSPHYEDFYGKDVYPQLARLARLRKDPAKRLEYLRKAQRLAPKARRTFSDLGEFYLDTHAPAQALKVLREGLFHHPKAKGLRIEALEAAGLAGSWKLYRELLEEGSRMHGRSAELAIYSAIQAMRSGDGGGALPLFDAAIPVVLNAKQPLPVLSLESYPRCLVQQGQTRRARDFLSKHLDDPRLTKQQRRRMSDLLRRAR